MSPFKRIVLAMILAAGTSPAPAQSPAAPANKFGFVNTDRVLREAPSAVAAQKRIDAEFKQRNQELSDLATQLKKIQDEMEKSSVTMSESQRRTREREFGELNRDFQRK